MKSTGSNHRTQGMEIICSTFLARFIPLIDLQEKIVYQEKHAYHYAPISIAHLSNGYYTILVTDSTSAPVRLSFIKQ